MSSLSQPGDDAFRALEPPIVSASRAMQVVCEQAERAAAGEAKVLITGESGVGKDLIARYIHLRSARAVRPFVAVNCAAFTETLLQSELFGHVRGSFTDAYRDQPGKFQLAHRGTIFLDEIGEMSLRMQALLLRFLENGEIQSVGADTSGVRLDVRIIAATNRNLTELVAGGQFREDLLYRIRVVHLHVPPLRDRQEDIVMLTQHMVARSGRAIRFTDDALLALKRHRWPGNVRELQNVVEQLIWMSAADVVAQQDLPPALTAPCNALAPVHERRRQLADDLYSRLTTGAYSFWDDVYPLFLSRDLTRHDVRELVRRGLASTFGNYRGLLKLFRIEEQDYKRFLNFLTTHDCRVDFREFRKGQPEDVAAPRTNFLPPGRERTGPARRLASTASESISRI